MDSNKIKHIKDHLSFVSTTSSTHKNTSSSKTFSRKMSKQRKTFNFEKNLIGSENRTRVFLYLQPKAIKYPSADNILVNVVIEHPLRPITRLSDKRKPENVINVNTFDEEKPTFSIILEQDSYADIEACVDSPLTVTLYEQPIRDDVSEISRESRSSQKLQGKAKAQGYLDLFPYFTKKRIMLNVNVFLYPLDPSDDKITCQMVWDIYSLMPLLKRVNLSNILFITFTSIYNIDGTFLNDYQKLSSALSLRINSSNVEERNEKIFICKYTGFSKEIIIEQTKFCKWENMKDPERNNGNSLAICSQTNFSIHKIFSNVFCSEYFNFNFWSIDINNDYALVCNSLHRFTLTEQMHISLEQYLADGPSEIIVDVFDESKPDNILLQGVIDLSIFMYPNVTACSFAVDLKPPSLLRRSSVPSSPFSPGRKQSSPVSSGRRRSSASPKRKQSEKDLAKPIFAVIKICAQAPITDPPMGAFAFLDNNSINVNMTRDVYRSCGSLKNGDPNIPLKEMQCVESYRQFDDNILYLKKNISEGKFTVADEKQKFCETRDMCNRILPLIACDFNVRYPTNTNAEFTDLMTTVYRELVDRSYQLINLNCENSVINSPIAPSSVQNILVDQISLAKYMRAIGNWDMYQCLLRRLKDQFSASPMLRFYMFIYNLELEEYNLARDYIQTPLNEQDPEGQTFINICKIYLDYIRDKKNPEIENKCENDLLIALNNLCEIEQPKLAVGWMLLYCIYKRHNYQPGISYSRWQYENLIREGLFMEIEYLPRSLWEVFNDFKPFVNTVKGENLWKGIDLLLRLGLYNFAQLVYFEIIDDLTAVERYILNANFKMIAKDLEYFPIVNKFPVDKLPNSAELNAFVNLANGNIEYVRNPSHSSWIQYYASILSIEGLEDTFHFQLGTLRYAFKMLAEKEFEMAIRALDYASDSHGHGLVKSVIKAKALYYLGRLKEAELCLAGGTNYNLFLPNVWAGLALINLRLGENYKALECWKYARSDPTILIDEEILDELSKVDSDNIKLYVDVPASN